MKTYPNIINMTGTDLDILKASYADLIEESIKKKMEFTVTDLKDAMIMKKENPGEKIIMK